MRDPQRDIAPGQRHIAGRGTHQGQNHHGGVKQRRLLQQMRVIVRFPVDGIGQDPFQVLSASARLGCAHSARLLKQRRQAGGSHPREHDERPQHQCGCGREYLRLHDNVPLVFCFPSEGCSHGNRLSIATNPIGTATSSPRWPALGQSPPHRCCRLTGSPRFARRSRLCPPTLPRVLLRRRVRSPDAAWQRPSAAPRGLPPG